MWGGPTIWEKERDRLLAYSLAYSYMNMCKAADCPTVPREYSSNRVFYFASEYFLLERVLRYPSARDITISQGITSSTYFVV